jgi:hypothetical protein
MVGKKKKPDPGFKCLDVLLEMMVKRGGFLGAVVVPSGSTALVATFYKDGSRAVLESNGEFWDYARDEFAAETDFDEAFSYLVAARDSHSGLVRG